MWTVACLLVVLAATPTPVTGAAPQADPSASSSEEALRRYAQARLLEERGSSAEAMAEYYRILAIDPGSKTVALRLSELAGQIGDAPRSLELAEHVLKSHPDDPRALWLRGSARFNLDQREAGLADLAHAVELDSTTTEYSRSLGRAAEDLNRVDLVARAYHNVVQMDWDDDESWFQLAAADARLGRFQEAQWALHEALEPSADRPGAQFLQGWVAEGLGQRDSAIIFYRRHLEIHAADQVTRARLVHLLGAQGRFDEALKEARVVAAASPDDLDALEDVADLAYHTGHADEGKRALAKMEAIDPDSPGGLGRRLDVLARNQRTKEASEAAKRWSDQHPGDYRGPLLEARALAMGGKPEAALAPAQRATAMAPDSLAPRLVLARVQQDQRHYTAAAATWEETAQRFPKEVGVALDYAFCVQESGDTARAERIARDALGRFPDDARVLNFLGYLLADANRELTEAEQLVGRAIELEPDNGAFIDSMGWVYYRQGRLADARRELERAVSLTGGDAVVREHLGDVYRGLGLPDLARDQYRRALAADTGNSRVKNKLQKLP